MDPKKILPIPKEEKYLTNSASYRPISLLNVYYKILAMILATRLNYIMPKNIHTDQASFLKGRYLKDIITKLINILNHSQNNE